MRVRLILGFVLVSTLLSLFVSSGPAISAPVKKEVIMSATISLTGPAAPSAGFAFKAINHYISWLNETKGGINGHPIKLLYTDTRYDTSLAMAHYRRWGDQGTLVNFVYGTMEMMTIGETATKENRAIVAHATHSKPFIERWNIFSPYVSHSELAPVVVKWLVDNWKGTGIPKLQWIVWPNIGGRNFLDANDWIKKNLKCEVLETIETAFPVTDLTPYLLEADRRGANFVMFGCDASTFGAAIRDMRRQGLKMTLSTGASPQASPEAIAVCGDEAAKGVVSSFTAASVYDESVPETANIRQVQMRHHGNVSEDANYINGCGMAMVAVEAVKRAMDKVGIDKLTHGDVVTAFKEIKNFKTNGLFHPISYSENRRIGQRYVQIGVYEGKDRWKRVTPWTEAPLSVPGITE